MTRSADFTHVVRRGVRAAQPDLVVHACRAGDGSLRRPAGAVPQVGFIVAKSVGGAVERNRAARRLRHLTRNLLGDLDATDRIVVRALPGSRDAESSRLGRQLETAIRRVHVLMDRQR